MFWSQFTLAFEHLSHVNLTEVLAVEDEAVHNVDSFKNTLVKH